MTNRDIARVFNRLAKIMELHGENPFKIRSYSSAYVTLRKVDQPLIEMTADQLDEIKGVGKAIRDKIIELGQTGELQTYQKYVDKTPEGIVEMLDIKGFGPKKIKVVWEELGITDIGELLYACNENRLVELKGFGQKTQETLTKQLEYFLSSKGKYHYASLEEEAHRLVAYLKTTYSDYQWNLCGGVRRMMPIVEGIDVLTTADSGIVKPTENLVFVDDKWLMEGYPVTFISVPSESYGSELFKRSASEEFLEAFGSIAEGQDESGIFAERQMAYIHPEYRESAMAVTQAQEDRLPTLIEDGDLKGVIHNHSTYSDGMHTLAEMADYTKSSGYEYLVISDHSKAAFYANGLNEDRCRQQMEEIDQLNAGYDGFKVFKSIECDILNDGSLDYDDDFLKEFDLVIASVHTNLKMDQTKADARLIKAIEHPSTHILGHPTGRLLLSREGYPIDHMKVIDACIDNGVVIELNANPHRLDIDWTWIPYVLEKGGMISINPDAHNKAHIHYMKYGVSAARKGGLTADSCLNAKSLTEFQKWVDGLPK